MNEFDDFSIESQDDWYDCEENEPYLAPASRKRKEDWHHAKRNYRILKNKVGKQAAENSKPLHYYSKTKPEIYHNTPVKNWSIADKRKIQSRETQIKELFDIE